MTASHNELASLLEGAPWRRVAALGDGGLSWVDRLAGGLDAAAVRTEELSEALAFGPDLAILAPGDDPSRPELERTVRALRRVGADVMMLEHGAHAATREVAAQYGAIVTGLRGDHAVVATEVARVLAAASVMRVAA